MDFLLPRRALPLQLVSGRSHYQAVVQAALGAECSLWIATANLKDVWVGQAGGRGRSFRSVLEALDELAARRVELRILHASYPSRSFRESFDRHPRLVRGGLELRLCPRVHFKAVIIDGALLYLGSANWTGAGLGAKGSDRRNFELGLLTEDADTLDRVQALYQRVWSGGECRTCRVRSRCEAPLDGRPRCGHRRSTKPLT